MNVTDSATQARVRAFADNLEGHWSWWRSRSEQAVAPIIPDDRGLLYLPNHAENYVVAVTPGEHDMVYVAEVPSPSRVVSGVLAGRELVIVLSTNGSLYVHTASLILLQVIELHDGVSDVVWAEDLLWVAGPERSHVEAFDVYEHPNGELVFRSYQSIGGLEGVQHLVWLPLARTVAAVSTTSAHFVAPDYTVESVPLPTAVQHVAAHDALLVFTEQQTGSVLVLDMGSSAITGLLTRASAVLSNDPVVTLRHGFHWAWHGTYTVELVTVEEPGTGDVSAIVQSIEASDRAASGTQPELVVHVQEKADFFRLAPAKDCVAGESYLSEEFTLDGAGTPLLVVASGCSIVLPEVEDAQGAYRPEVPVAWVTDAPLRLRRQFGQTDGLHYRAKLRVYEAIEQTLTPDDLGAGEMTGVDFQPGPDGSLRLFLRNPVSAMGYWVGQYVSPLFPVPDMAVTRDVRVAAGTSLPEGTHVTLEYRCQYRAALTNQLVYSDWVTVPPELPDSAKLQGVQVRLYMTTTDLAVTPEVFGFELDVVTHELLTTGFWDNHRTKAVRAVADKSLVPAVQGTDGRREGSVSQQTVDAYTRHEPGMGTPMLQPRGYQLGPQLSVNWQGGDYVLHRTSARYQLGRVAFGLMPGAGFGWQLSARFYLNGLPSRLSQSVSGDPHGLGRSSKTGPRIANVGRSPERHSSALLRADHHSAAGSGFQQGTTFLPQTDLGLGGVLVGISRYQPGMRKSDVQAYLKVRGMAAKLLGKGSSFVIQRSGLQLTRDASFGASYPSAASAQQEATFIIGAGTARKAVNPLRPSAYHTPLKEVSTLTAASEHGRRGVLGLASDYALEVPSANASGKGAVWDKLRSVAASASGEGLLAATGKAGAQSTGDVLRAAGTSGDHHVGQLVTSWSARTVRPAGGAPRALRRELRGVAKTTERWLSAPASARRSLVVDKAAKMEVAQLSSKLADVAGYSSLASMVHRSAGKTIRLRVVQRGVAGADGLTAYPVQLYNGRVARDCHYTGSPGLSSSDHAALMQAFVARSHKLAPGATLGFLLERGSRLLEVQRALQFAIDSLVLSSAVAGEAAFTRDQLLADQLSTLVTLRRMAPSAPSAGGASAAGAAASAGHSPAPAGYAYAGIRTELATMASDVLRSWVAATPLDGGRFSRVILGAASASDAEAVVEKLHVAVSGLVKALASGGQVSAEEMLRFLLAAHLTATLPDKGLPPVTARDYGHPAPVIDLLFQTVAETYHSDQMMASRQLVSRAAGQLAGSFMAKQTRQFTDTLYTCLVATGWQAQSSLYRQYRVSRAEVGGHRSLRLGVTVREAASLGATLTGVSQIGSRLLNYRSALSVTAHDGGTMRGLAYHSRDAVAEGARARLTATTGSLSEAIDWQRARYTLRMNALGTSRVSVTSAGGQTSLPARHRQQAALVRGGQPAASTARFLLVAQRQPFELSARSYGDQRVQWSLLREAGKSALTGAGVLAGSTVARAWGRHLSVQHCVGLTSPATGYGRLADQYVENGVRLRLAPQAGMASSSVGTAAGSWQSRLRSRLLSWGHAQLNAVPADARAALLRASYESDGVGMLRVKGAGMTLGELIQTIVTAEGALTQQGAGFYRMTQSAFGQAVRVTGRGAGQLAEVTMRTTLLGGSVVHANGGTVGRHASMQYWVKQIELAPGASQTMATAGVGVLVGPATPAHLSRALHARRVLNQATEGELRVTLGMSAGRMGGLTLSTPSVSGMATAAAGGAAPARSLASLLNSVRLRRASPLSVRFGEKLIARVYREAVGQARIALSAGGACTVSEHAVLLALGINRALATLATASPAGAGLTALAEAAVSLSRGLAASHGLPNRFRITSAQREATQAVLERVYQSRSVTKLVELLPQMTSYGLAAALDAVITTWTAEMGRTLGTLDGTGATEHQVGLASEGSSAALARAQAITVLGQSMAIDQMQACLLQPLHRIKEALSTLGGVGSAHEVSVLAGMIRDMRPLPVKAAVTRFLPPVMAAQSVKLSRLGSEGYTLASAESIVGIGHGLRQVSVRNTVSRTLLRMASVDAVTLHSSWTTAGAELSKLASTYHLPVMAEFHVTTGLQLPGGKHASDGGLPYVGYRAVGGIDNYRLSTVPLLVEGARFVLGTVELVRERGLLARLPTPFGYWFPKLRLAFPVGVPEWLQDYGILSPGLMNYNRAWQYVQDEETRGAALTRPRQSAGPVLVDAPGRMLQALAVFHTTELDGHRWRLTGPSLAVGAESTGWKLAVANSLVGASGGVQLARSLRVAGAVVMGLGRSDLSERSMTYTTIDAYRTSRLAGSTTQSGPMVANYMPASTYRTDGYHLSTLGGMVPKDDLLRPVRHMHSLPGSWAGLVLDKSQMGLSSRVVMHRARLSSSVYQRPVVPLTGEVSAAEAGVQRFRLTLPSDVPVGLAAEQRFSYGGNAEAPELKIGHRKDGTGFDLFVTNVFELDADAARIGVSVDAMDRLRPRTVLAVARRISEVLSTVQPRSADPLPYERLVKGPQPRSPHLKWVAALAERVIGDWNYRQHRPSFSATVVEDLVAALRSDVAGDQWYRQDRQGLTAVVRDLIRVLARDYPIGDQHYRQYNLARADMMHALVQADRTDVQLYNALVQEGLSAHQIEFVLRQVQQDAQASYQHYRQALPEKPWWSVRGYRRNSADSVAHADQLYRQRRESANGLLRALRQVGITEVQADRIYAQLANVTGGINLFKYGTYANLVVQVGAAFAQHMESDPAALFHYRMHRPLDTVEQQRYQGALTTAPDVLDLYKQASLGNSSPVDAEYAVEMATLLDSIDYSLLKPLPFHDRGNLNLPIKYRSDNFRRYKGGIVALDLMQWLTDLRTQYREELIAKIVAGTAKGAYSPRAAMMQAVRNNVIEPILYRDPEDGSWLYRQFELTDTEYNYVVWGSL